MMKLKYRSFFAAFAMFFLGTEFHAQQSRRPQAPIRDAGTEADWLGRNVSVQEATEDQLPASTLNFTTCAGLDFGELPFQAVNGLSFAGVGFTFTVGGLPSTDANYNSGGPGTITYVQVPALEGASAGTLRLDFSLPTRVLSFGVARNTVVPLTPGFTVQVFDSSLMLIGTFPVNTTPLVTFSEGQFIYPGSTAIKRAVVTFNSPGTGARFALDNLSYQALVLQDEGNGNCLALCPHSYAFKTAASGTFYGPASFTQTGLVLNFTSGPGDPLLLQGGGDLSRRRGNARLRAPAGSSTVHTIVDNNIDNNPACP